MCKKCWHLFLTVYAIAVISCTSHTAPENNWLTQREYAICDSMKLDTSVIQDIRAYNYNKIEPFHYSLSEMYRNDSVIELAPVFLKGIVFEEQNAESHKLILALKGKLKKRGYSIFLLDNNFDINQKRDVIAVVNSIDKYDILKHLETDGTNYNIDNDSLLTIIKHFDAKYDLELAGAAGDWCEFVINKPVVNWMQLANEAYKVCPDIVDQGTGSIEALADEMRKNRRLYFWWD